MKNIEKLCVNGLKSGCTISNSMNQYRCAFVVTVSREGYNNYKRRHKFWLKFFVFLGFFELIIR